MPAGPAGTSAAARSRATFGTRPDPLEIRANGGEVGTLPEGAHVVTIVKSQGQLGVFNSRSIHGNQLPAPQAVVDAVTTIFR